MKEKALAVLAKAKDLAVKAASLAPLPAGIAIGYFGHGLIKMGLDGAMALAKLVLHL